VWLSVSAWSTRMDAGGTAENSLTVMVGPSHPIIHTGTIDRGPVAASTTEARPRSASPPAMSPAMCEGAAGISSRSAQASSPCTSGAVFRYRT
jgi:hypothetical protein